MRHKEIVTKLQQTFDKHVESSQEEGAFPFVVIQHESLKAVLSYCLHDPAMLFDFLECLTGFDTGQDLIVIYQLYSTTLNHKLNIKVAVERHNAYVASVSGFWQAAFNYEREAAEMFGLTFIGHPSATHLLLPEDWQGYPFRKDYVFPEEYHGVEHRRAPLRREHTRP